METNQEQNRRYCQKSNENGNALIYVLIAIALFAALSFTLGRQGDNSESSQLDEQQAELYATQFISYAAQAKSAVDQMLFTGSTIDDLDFTLPNQAGFNAGSPIHKVYHPQGGGLNPGHIPEKAKEEISTTPPSNWYMASFNNTEWTATANNDVLLVAYQISEPICESINKKITGSPTIPALTGIMSRYLLDTSDNADFTTDPSGSPVCAACHELPSLCVSNDDATAFSFYTVIADQ